jgi:DNA-binding winged helix-turn-helix (wHTH) protein/TolB-like protein/thioredoxin-like negative regulator of GroEL
LIPIIEGVEPTGSAALGVLRFGIFELDEAAGELRRNGSIVRLPPQPFQVLQLLVHNEGELVDRERIRREVWGETAVDFDRSLNVCVAQIRAALNDNAESPRFVQTLPRRGYRFLATVERAGELSPPIPVQPLAQTRRWPRLLLAASLLLLAGIAAAGYRLSHPAEQAVRIAVLPFDRVGLPGEDNAQIEGLFDELLTRLGGVQPDRLRVIGRRSVARFQNERKPLREIGQRLNVIYALEATVRVDGGRLRVAMRLAQTESETVLWSGSFTQEGDPGRFEEDLVARVSAAVLTKLFPDATPAREAAPGCRNGWEAYRTGSLLANQGTRAGLQKSLPFFEQANCPAAQAALADALTRIARDGTHPELLESARTAALAALKSDPGIGSAHRSLANVAFWRDWNWKTAESELQLALRRNPSDSDAHHDLAWLLVATGRRQEALAALARAISLDPLSARISMDAGWLLLQAHRFREAALQARRTLDLDPGMNEARACLARALLYAGDDRAALEAMRPLLRPDEAPLITGVPPDQAMRNLFRAAIRPQGTMDPYQRAWRLAWVGEREEALAQVEDAFRKRSGMMPLVAVDPAFASIRNDPRFEKIVRQMGL